VLNFCRAIAVDATTEILFLLILFDHLQNANISVTSNCILIFETVDILKSVEYNSQIKKTNFEFLISIVMADSWWLKQIAVS